MNTRTKPRKPCAITIDPCECGHHNALTCQSEQVWQSRKSLAERRGGKR